MKKLGFKEKFNKSRTVYVMAAISFCLTALAIGVAYSQATNKLEKDLTSISTTQNVNKNQQNEKDPRTEDGVTVTSPERKTTVKQTTTKKSKPTTTEPTDYEEPLTEMTEATEAVVATAQTFIMPHDGEIVRVFSSDVPLYCETMNDWRTHNGIDIAVNEGDEVVSVGKGKVSKVLVDSNYGYTIEVDYGSFTARYCGMKQGESVGIDQMLEKGDSIGMVDSVPCEVKSAPHFHFEIVKNGDYVDPAKELKQ